MAFGPRPSPLLDGVSKFGPMQKAATDHIRARLQGTDTVTAVRYSRHSAKACAGVFPALSDWRNAPRKSARPAKREVCADGAQYPERAPSLAYRICISYAIYGITHCTLSPAMDGARDAGNIPSLAPELRPRRRHWELLLHPAIWTSDIPSTYCRFTPIIYPRMHFRRVLRNPGGQRVFPF